MHAVVTVCGSQRAPRAAHSACTRSAALRLALRLCLAGSVLTSAKPTGGGVIRAVDAQVGMPGGGGGLSTFGFRCHGDNVGAPALHAVVAVFLHGTPRRWLPATQYARRARLAQRL